MSHFRPAGRPGIYLWLNMDGTGHGWERIPEDMDDTNSVWIVRITVDTQD